MQPRRFPLLWLITVFSCGSDPSEGPSGPGSASGADSSTDASSATDPSSTTDGPSSTSGTSSTGQASSTGPGPSSSTSQTTGNGADIWQPSPGLTWQWQLMGEIDSSFDVQAYDIDLFDVDASAIAELQAQGRIVICYFSAGSHEDWRPDADAFPQAAIGMQLDEWPGERWIDHRDPGIREVMAARLDLAVSKGCDAVEPDNVDGYTNETGFDLSASDQLDYNRWLADQAHARGLSVGLKNDVDQVEELVDDFDWALNEECMAYDECDTLAPFIEAGKAVLHVEYVDDPAQGPDVATAVCPDALSRQFSTLIKGWDLDPWMIACE